MEHVWNPRTAQSPNTRLPHRAVGPSRTYVRDSTDNTSLRTTAAAVGARAPLTVTERAAAANLGPEYTASRARDVSSSLAQARALPLLLGAARGRMSPAASVCAHGGKRCARSTPRQHLLWVLSAALPLTRRPSVGLVASAGRVAATRARGQLPLRSHRRRPPGHTRPHTRPPYPALYPAPYPARFTAPTARGLWLSCEAWARTLHRSFMSTRARINHKTVPRDFVHPQAPVSRAAKLPAPTTSYHH